MVSFIVTTLQWNRGYNKYAIIMKLYYSVFDLACPGALPGG